MVQRYPSSDKPLEEERPPAPKPVENAVKLMYVGAAISTVSLIISLVFIGTIKSTIKTEFPNYTDAPDRPAFDGVHPRRDHLGRHRHRTVALHGAV